MTREEINEVKDALELVATRLERYHIIGTDDRAALQKAKSAIKLLRKETQSEQYNRAPAQLRRVRKDE